MPPVRGTWQPDERFLESSAQGPARDPCLTGTGIRRAKTVDTAAGAEALDIIARDGRPAIALAPAAAGGQQAAGWIGEHRAEIRAALDNFGHLLIRGLKIEDVDDFVAARDAYFGDHLPYRERSTPRSEFAKGVYSSTDLPARHPIRLHNESSYVLTFPGTLLFGCVEAAAEGGATTVGDSREVLRRLDPALAASLREHGWTLLRNYHPSLSLSWSDAYGIADRGALEDYLRKHLTAWRWRPDGGLMTSQLRAAVLRHPATGEETWFNHVAFWNRHTMAPDFRAVLLESYGEDGLPYDTLRGDGTPLTEEEAGHLNEVYRQVERCEPYRAGDLLLVDNLISCHGRQPYRGERRVLVAMGEARSVYDCAPSVSPGPGTLPVRAPTPRM